MPEKHSLIIGVSRLKTKICRLSQSLANWRENQFRNHKGTLPCQMSFVAFACSDQYCICLPANLMSVLITIIAKRFLEAKKKPGKKSWRKRNKTYKTQRKAWKSMPNKCPEIDFAHTSTHTKHESDALWEAVSLTLCRLRTHELGRFATHFRQTDGLRV